ncbi:alanine--tRNA ligase-related protein [Sporosarcina sp. NPDC096371]|uniref:alanyl-tRNA editing protein n=1 Tax=Sporosarcina sp. NPDC096371 TaxID=3364530 RepID=UPI0038040488
MLKDRLYYVDPYCQSFTANVVSTSQDEQGQPYVVLDNTAFYPEGGGQPADTGSLNGISVLYVEDVDGEIRHTLAESLEGATEVEGIIDWKRRFDHMQQHAGQHILSAAFVELFDFPTVSFHLGKELVSIDLDTEEVSSEQLKAVERLANDVILENRPIETKWVTEDELEQYSLRKQLSVTDEIRLVIIPNFDDNGCGGTHPNSTGQVSALKILSTEKQKRKVRVHFVCGGRVLQQLQQKNKRLTTASQLLSAPEDGVAEAVEKLLATNHSLEKSLEEAQESLLAFEAKELLNTQHQGVVKAVFTGRTVQQLQKLAKLLVTENDDTTALLVADNEDRLQFVAARGAAVETSMKQISAAALPLINGKGGGNDAFVQGGGERTVTAVDLVSAMENTFKTTGGTIHA